ncbi:unnamed protein product [Sympodiomycopsis kandeliae]
MSAATTIEPPRLIDIAVNLTDPVFRGTYHGKQYHEDDYDEVMNRARRAGVVTQIITGGSLHESREALQLCNVEDLVCTVGCHPTRSGEFDAHPKGPDGYLADLIHLLEDSAVTRQGKGRGKAVAIGECGLDYDRLHFAPKETQQRHFASQLSLAARFALPLFLHSRACAEDFVEILKPRISELAAAIGVDAGPAPALPQELTAAHGSGSAALRIGVVHSFTGSMEEMKQLVDLGLFIGVNFCSMKTEENLVVVKAIPLDRLMIETDAPWCEPRPSHASAAYVKQFESQHPDLATLYNPPAVKKEKHGPGKVVKGRCEPSFVGSVAGVIAVLKGLGICEVAAVTERNTRWLFGL